MFKLKPGNVFQKANSMSRKQAYTWGAVAVVLIVAFFTLSSLMGDAQDQSFSGLESRGYDLAQMPFVNDEAEQYLLASKYPDMQGNNSTLLYSAQQKEERQAKDAEKEIEQEETAQSFRESSSSVPTSRGYRPRSYGKSSPATPTQVNKLSSSSVGRASGGGVNGSWGAPRGDFSPYKSQDKGSERPVQFKNQDARKALYQFARGSQAAAGLKDGKSGNAKRALMGGDIVGSEAFEDGGIDLSKAQGLAIDTEAPATPDLSNLEQDLKDATERAQEEAEDDDKDERSWADKLAEEALLAVLDILKSAATEGVKAAFDKSNKSGESSGDKGDKPSGGDKPTTPTTPSTSPSSDPVPDDPTPPGGDSRDDGTIPGDLHGDDMNNFA